MNENDKMPFDFRLWEALKQKCCIKPEQANTIVFLGAERFLEAVGPVIKQYRNDIQREAREAERDRLTLVVHSLPATAFASAGAFKESAIKAIEAAASTEGGGGDG